MTGKKDQNQPPNPKRRPSPPAPPTAPLSARSGARPPGAGSPAGRVAGQRQPQRAPSSGQPRPSGHSAASAVGCGLGLESPTRRATGRMLLFWRDSSPNWCAIFNRRYPADYPALPFPSVPQRRFSPRRVPCRSVSRAYWHGMALDAEQSTRALLDTDQVIRPLRYQIHLSWKYSLGVCTLVRFESRP